MFIRLLCASRLCSQLPCAVKAPASAINPVCRRASSGAGSKSYREHIGVSIETAARLPLVKQILVGLLALLLAVQAAGANVLQPDTVKACCQCEADVNEMLSSMYGWIWGSDSQYCKKDFPDVGAASLLAEFCPCCQAQPADAHVWQVWAGFVDSFTDTLKARGAAVTPAHTQVHLCAVVGSHGQPTSMPLLVPVLWRLSMAFKLKAEHSGKCCTQSGMLHAMHAEHSVQSVPDLMRLANRARWHATCRQQASMSMSTAGCISTCARTHLATATAGK